MQASKVTEQIAQSISVKQAMLADGRLCEQIRTLAATCLRSLQRGGKIIFAGNGGSFADAQHLSAEFTCRYAVDRDSLPSLALGCNSSSMSAISNDYTYETVFARELSSIGRKDDVFIGISTSGNSKNVLKAIEQANAMGMTVVGFTGETGGKMADLCECIRVPSGVTGRIQEAHIMVGHIFCSMVEQALVGG